MNILYIDESGSPDKNDHIQNFSMVGVDVEMVKMKELIYGYYNLHRYYFPRLYASSLKNQSTMKQKIKILESRENKTLLSPKNICHQNKTFIFKLIELCEEKNVKVLGLTVFKDQLNKPAKADWLYPHCLQILTDTYSSMLKRTTSEGIIVLDSRDTYLDDHLSLSHSRYLMWNKRAKHYNNIAVLPFFTRSHISLIMQIAHFFSYITNMQYQCVMYKNKNYNYLGPIWQKLSSLFYGNAKGNEILVWR